LVRLRHPLNDRQLAVLTRVADGDDLREATNGDKRSASALHDRGLLSRTKRSEVRFPTFLERPIPRRLSSARGVICST
jgi:hypothetical protein